MPGLLTFPLNPDHLIGLLVDGRLLNAEDGWQGYANREPLCVEAFFKALAFGLANIKKDLNTKFIITINNIITQKNESSINHVANSQFRSESVGFTIPKLHTTKAGIEEIFGVFAEFEQLSEKPSLIYCSKSALGQSFDLFMDRNQSYREIAYDDIQNQGFDYTAPFPNPSSRHKISLCVEDMIDIYHQQMENVQEEDIKEKITIIVRLVANLERLHPFMDGNGRTFINVLLNVLLLSQNLPPAMIYEPNIFDLYSINQLSEMVLDAMHYSCFLAENPQSLVFGKDLTGSSCYFDHAAFHALVGDDKKDQSIAKIKEKLPLAYDGSLAILTDVLYGKAYPIDESHPDIFTLNDESLPTLYRGKNLFHLAIEFKHVNLMEEILLINKTKALNTKDSSDNFPVSYAISQKDLALIEKLLPDVLTYHDACQLLEKAASIYDVSSFCQLQHCLANKMSPQDNEKMFESNSESSNFDKQQRYRIFAAALKNNNDELSKHLFMDFKETLLVDNVSSTSRELIYDGLGKIPIFLFDELLLMLEKPLENNVLFRLAMNAVYKNNPTLFEKLLNLKNLDFNNNDANEAILSAIVMSDKFAIIALKSLKLSPDDIPDSFAINVCAYRSADVLILLLSHYQTIDLTFQSEIIDELITNDKATLLEKVLMHPKFEKQDKEQLLYQAITGKKAACVKVLLEHGADPSAINESFYFQESLLFHALNKSSDEITHLLMKHNANPSVPGITAAPMDSIFSSFGQKKTPKISSVLGLALSKNNETMIHYCIKTHHLPFNIDEFKIATESLEQTFAFYLESSLSESAEPNAIFTQISEQTTIKFSEAQNQCLTELAKKYNTEFTPMPSLK